MQRGRGKSLPPHERRERRSALPQPPCVSNRRRTAVVPMPAVAAAGTARLPACRAVFSRRLCAAAAALGCGRFWRASLEPAAVAARPASLCAAGRLHVPAEIQPPPPRCQVCRHHGDKVARETRSPQLTFGSPRRPGPAASSPPPLRHRRVISASDAYPTNRQPPTASALLERVRVQVSSRQCPQSIARFNFGNLVPANLRSKMAC